MPSDLIANRYETLRLLGQGAMGRVWLVHDTVTGNEIALKAIALAETATGSRGGAAVISKRSRGDTNQALLQFKQEFRLMTQLRHPNCCRVFDYGETAEHEPYLTMEVVPGQGLDECVPMPHERVREVLAQLLLALGYVHQLGFVHCDIKSANVRMRPDGAVKLMDFGLMDYANRAHASLRGTLPYVSPEMVRRAPIDQRADLYSVGCLTYELLTGKLPFERRTPVEVLRAHVGERPEPPSRVRSGVPADLDAVVMRLLEKEPVERFQSAFDVLRALGIEAPAAIGGTLLASPMQGREAEQAALAGRLAAIADGQAVRPLWAHGPAGVGKSRLLEEFRWRVQLDHVAFVIGRASEQAVLPYQPFVQLLRALLPALREQAADALATHAPVLVRLLPELAVAPAPEMDTPAKEKVRLQAAAAAVLSALAAHAPFVAVLEDWQWADPLSRELLAYVLRNAADAPIALVLASREAPEPNAEGLEPLAIAPLGSEPLGRMLRAMLGARDGELAEGFAEQVEAITGGNPFYLERLLEHLVAEGTLRHTDGAWDTGIVLDVEALTHNVQALLLGKLEKLPPDALCIARAGAVLGGAFGLAALAHVHGLDEERAFEGFAALNAQGIFTQIDKGVYTFAQEALARAIYETLPTDDRVPLHRAAARALIADAPDTPIAGWPSDRVVPIAEHLLRAELPEEAVPFAYEAGIRHARLLAGTEAERFLLAGLALLSAHPALGNDALRLDYLQALGDVRRFTGQAASAREALEQAVTLAEALGRHSALGRLLASLAKACQVLDDYPAAIAHGERAVAIAEADGDTAGAARALLTISRIRFFTGNKQAAVQGAERALDLARASGEIAITGQAYAFLGYLFVAADAERVPEGVRHLTTSLAMLQEAGDRIGLNNSYNLLGNAQNALGEFEAARGSFLQNHRLSVETGQHAEEVFARVNLAISAVELGDFAEARAQADRAVASATRLKLRFPLGMAIALEGLARLQCGEVTAGLARIEEALALALEIKNKYLEAAVRIHHAEALAFAGRLAPAREATAALETLIAETGNPEPEHRLALLKAELAVRANDPRSAQPLVEGVLAAARASRAAGAEARALWTQAAIALAAEDWDAARAAAESGLALARRLGARAVAAELLGCLGEHALATGADAASSFAEMEAEAEAIGAPVLLAIARFGRAAAKPYEAQAAGLVADARALLERLAAGMAAADAAAFLGLPERARIMAGNHVAFSLPRAPRRAPEGPRRPFPPGMGMGGF